MTKENNTPSVGQISKVNARLLALKIINSVFYEGAYANIALNKALSANKNLNDLDRRFVTELVYGTIKAKGTIDWLLTQNISRPLHKVSPVILNILRLGMFQIFFLARIPASAACNEAVNLAKKFGHQGTAKFVNGVLRNSIRNKEHLTYPTLEVDKVLHVALTYQHPQWLAGRWIKQYGLEEAIKLCEYNNHIPPLTLRVNTLLISREELLTKLLKEDFAAKNSEWCADGIVCQKIPSLSVLFDKFGQYIYIQDESSMLVGGILAPHEGETIIDVCSAPGGKTTHLAQLMQNKGRIIAADVHEHKIALIKENAARLGINIIQAQVQDATKRVAQWVNLADKVLVDAPCSGLGVLGRRAEARWTKTKEDLATFPPLQLTILENAAAYLKVGGKLVYSTCTLEKAENSAVIEKFLANNTNFRLAGFKHPKSGDLINELQILPQNDGIDGFYICALEKKA